MSPNRPNKSNKSTCQYPWITADTENGGSYNSYPIIHFQYQLSQGSISWYKIDTGHDFTPNLPKKLPNKSPICPFLFHGLADGVTIHIQQRQQHADVGQDHLSSSKKMEEIRVNPPRFIQEKWMVLLRKCDDFGTIGIEPTNIAGLTSKNSTTKDSEVFSGWNWGW